MIKQTKDVRVSHFGYYDLPEVVGFETAFASERFDPHFWEAVDYRIPLVGEYYLSGARSNVHAYLSPGSATDRFIIVKPTYKAIRETIYVKGEPFNDNTNHSL